MRTWKDARAPLAAALATMLLASPAAGQEGNRRAGEIAREIREAAEAIATVRGAVDESVNEIRFSSPRDRYAIDRCGPQVERYGRMRVSDVRGYGRRSVRVHGTVDRGGFGDRSGYGDGRRYGYRDRYGYGVRPFTCTVRDDGRVKLRFERRRRY